MANVFEIDLKQVISKLQKGKEYSIYTLYRDVPVNVKTKFLWSDISNLNQIYITFDWKNVSMKYAFQSNKTVYVKISIPYQNRELSFYIKCDIFSNLRDELVLMALSLVETPPFLNRSSVRVEIDYNKAKAFVNICIDDMDKCIENLTLKNISENGFAIMIKKDEYKEYERFLEEMKDFVNKEVFFSVEIYINKDLIRAKANLVNIYDEPNDIIAGFKMSVDKKDIQKLSSFIVKCQQEIIQEIKTL